jgi:hypothetical protein
MPIGLGLGIQIGRGTGGSGEPSLDYYVDSVNGSDDNAGTSPASAFASIGKLMTVLGDGDVIGLARGSYWRETIEATTTPNVTITAYGDGTLPSLDCADIATNGDFSLTAETTNVYEIEWVVETGGDENFISIWEDGVRLRWATSVANCDSTPGTFFSTAVGTTFTVYVHPYGSTVPASDGKLYEISRRKYGIHTGTNWLVQNVRTRRNHHNNGSTVLETNSRAEGCIFEDGVKHNALGAAGASFKDCIAYKCAYPERGDAILFVGFVLDGSGSTITFEGCIALIDEDIRNFGASTGPGTVTGFYAHTDGTPGNEFDQASFTGCLAAWCNTGIAGADTLVMVENANRIYRPFVGSQFLATFQSYQSTDCWIDMGSGGSGVRGLSLDCAEATITGMRAYVNRGSTDGFFYLSNDTAIVLSNNTLVLIPTAGYQYGLRATSSGSNLRMNNNLIIGNQDNGEVAVVAYYDPIAVNENVYAGSATCDAELEGVSYLNIADYFTAARAAGREINSVQGAVTLTDPAYGVQTSPTYLDVPSYEEIDAL